MVVSTPAPAVDPAIAAVVKQWPAPAPGGDLDDLRAHVERLMTTTIPQMGHQPGPVRSEEHWVPTPDAAAEGGPESVRVRVLTPDRDEGRVRPGVLYFFGGGFRLGSIDWPQIDLILRHRADAADVVVIGVDYALAPEYPYPIAAHQGIAALEWLHEHAAALGIAPEHVILNGQSSGGNLAVAAAQLNHARGRLPVHSLLLEIPSLDLTRGSLDLSVAEEMNATPAAIKADLVSFIGDYVPDLARRQEPLASPVLAEDLSWLPPTAVMMAEIDVFRGDGLEFVRRLRASGGMVTGTVHAGVTHDTIHLAEVAPVCREWDTFVLRHLSAGRHR